MKKLFALFITLTFVLSVNNFAQSVDIGSATGPAPVDVPVVVEFSPVSGGVAAFDFLIVYDTGLTFNGLTGIDGAALIPSQVDVTDEYSGAGTLRISWPATGDTPTSFDGTLFYLNFSGPVGGPYDIEFTLENDESGTPRTELVDSGPSLVTTTIWNYGDVSFTAPVPLKNWAIFIGLGLIIAFLVVRFRRIV